MSACLEAADFRSCTAIQAFIDRRCRYRRQWVQAVSSRHTHYGWVTMNAKIAPIVIARTSFSWRHCDFWSFIMELITLLKFYYLTSAFASENWSPSTREHYVLLLSSSVLALELNCWTLWLYCSNRTSFPSATLWLHLTLPKIHADYDRIRFGSGILLQFCYRQNRLSEIFSCSVVTWHRQYVMSQKPLGLFTSCNIAKFYASF